METKSKKGATSSHTIAAKGGCLKHNRREQKAANVVPERTYLNESWESNQIKNLKTLTSIKKKAAKLYTEKQHQKCQKSFTPYKESCVVIKEISTLEEAKKFAKSVEKLTGIQCVGIWIHKDEGYYRRVFSEGDNEFKCNYHAHFLWYCQNENTGKAIPIKREEMRQMQDLAAEAFGMERGNSATLTKRSHIQSMRFKMQQEEERLSKLLENIKTAMAVQDEKNEEIEPLNIQISQLKGKLEYVNNQKEMMEKDIRNLQELKNVLETSIQSLTQTEHDIKYAQFTNIVLIPDNAGRNSIRCKINGEIQSSYRLSVEDNNAFRNNQINKEELAAKYFKNDAEEMGYKIKR